MEQSLQVLEWQAEAEKRGEMKGEAKGKAEALLRIVERRFQVTVPPELAAIIRATTDLAKLNRWVDAAFDITSLDDFRRLIQA